jgi:hypothetical protein
MTLTLPPLQPWTRPRDAVRQLLAGATASTCLPVALVVGTLLSLVLANYTIPFLTSSTGALLAVRERPPVED